jgi:hypothetical protein
MAPQAGAGGLSDQEQKYVRIVWHHLLTDSTGASLTRLTGTIGHGIVSGQVDHGRWNGLCTGRRIWPVHVQCTSHTNSFSTQMHRCSMSRSNHHPHLPSLASSRADNPPRCLTTRHSHPKVKQSPIYLSVNKSGAASRTWARNLSPQPKTSLSLALSIPAPNAASKGSARSLT